ncbi:hypothetical protein, partial [Streptomyces sp. SP18CS02]|uniref:hypothetical protein n=1 Tax=Streptomyces sp. SP18CS02 TaxID=3002531 RepID=UPI002E769E92
MGAPKTKKAPALVAGAFFVFAGLLVCGWGTRIARMAMSSEAGSAAKRSTARSTRAVTAPAVRPVHVVRTSARPSSPSMRV